MSPTNSLPGQDNAFGRQPSDEDKARTQEKAFYANCHWISSTERLPEPDRLVLVKLTDGRIIGSWRNSKTSKWTHSPFESWGQPISWAALPKVGTK